MKLGQQLRSLRKEKNLTLKDLSELADLSVPYLSDMERGAVNPSVESLKKVAEAFNMTVRDILSGVEKLGESGYSSYPEGFESFLKDPDFSEEINDEWIDFLMNMKFRGIQPTSKREWIELYLNLRRTFSPEKKNE